MTCRLRKSATVYYICDLEQPHKTRYLSADGTWSQGPIALFWTKLEGAAFFQSHYPNEDLGIEEGGLIF